MYLLGQKSEYFFVNDTPEYVLYDHSNAMTLQKILAIVSLLFIPLILLTNSLVFWSTIICTHFHTPLNVMLFSLCIANLCMGCICIPVFCVSFIESTGYVIYSTSFHCILWFASSWISAGGALVSLLIISLERYLAIVWPDIYRSVASVKSAIIVVMVCWLYILGIALFPVFDWQGYREKLIIAKRCNYFNVIPKYYSFVLTVVTIYLTIAIPLLLHILICKKLYKQMRTYNRDLDHFSKEVIQSFETDVSSVIMTFALVLLFIILWFPYLTIVTFNYFERFHERQFHNLQDISQIFYFSSAMIPAPLFAVMRRDYKVVYLLMLRTLPWNWKNVVARLDHRKKSRQFRFPSTVTVIRPSMLHARSAPTTDSDLITQEAGARLEEPLEPIRPIEHWSVSSMYPDETTIY